MAGFTMKAAAPSTNTEGGGGKQVDASEWQAWNEYQFSCFEEDAITKKDRLVKSSPLVGILNMIVDMGDMPQLDGVYDVKAGVTSPEVGTEGNTPEELAYMEEYKNSYFKWEKDFKTGNMVRKQCSPRKPEHEIALYVDFPDIMIDMSKHPYSESTEADMKPLRIFLNGIFNKVHGSVRTSKKRDGTFPDNIISKIANASGVGQEFIDSGYDIGVIAGVACKYEVELSLTQGEQKFFNMKAKAPSKITEVKAGKVTVSVEEQIPECNVPFVGILMNGGDYSEDNLRFLRKDLKDILKESKTFEGSDLDKALQARSEAYSKSLKEKEGNAPEPKQTPPANGEEAPAANTEPQEDKFDDDIPF
jgi:hypothetical protein